MEVAAVEVAAVEVGAVAADPKLAMISSRNAFPMPLQVVLQQNRK